jgi:hypothetical protein
LASIDVNVTEDELNSFLDRDNENSLEYIEAVMEDVNDLLNSQAVENTISENSDDETDAAQMDDEGQATFIGFDNLYDKMLALEDQLLCKEFENEAGEHYEMLMSSFSLFQNRLRAVTMDVKRRRVTVMRQITLHDAFANNKRSILFLCMY